MRKKGGVKPKFAVVLALAVVLVLLYYGYQANWFTNTSSDSTAAVSASVSSTSGKLVTGAKAVSGSTASPQPAISVTSWPTFEMKYDSVGNENNLVVKSEYSLTAQGSKLYIPINWGTMSIKNNAGQYSYPKTTETKSLDPVTVVYCGWGTSCYEIPKDKTVRFVSRQVYDPKIMFGGIYTAKMDWIYFSTSATSPDFYYKPFPGQTSKLANITVVGEKSPYITGITSTSTNSAIFPANNFFINGVRFTGSTVYAMRLSDNVSFPLRTLSVSSNQAIVEFNSTATPGLYALYLQHPTYGKSNYFNVELSKAPVTGSIKILSPNGGESFRLGQVAPISFWSQGLIGKTVRVRLYNNDTGLNYEVWALGISKDGNDTINFIIDSSLPSGNKYVMIFEVIGTSPLITDKSDGYISLYKSTTAGKPQITFVSADESVNVDDGNDDDTGIFTIKYRVEAVGGTIYVSDSAKAIATTTAPYNVSDGKGVLYVLDEAGTPTTADVSALVTFSTTGGASDSGVINGVRLDDGESAEFTLTVARTNSGDSTDDGLYRMLLRGIGWATTDTPNFQIYRPGLFEGYQTDPVNLN